MSKPRARCGLPRAKSLLHVVQRQICLTLAGCSIVVLVLVSCGLIYTTTSQHTFNAIEQTAQAYRATLLEDILEEVAMTLVPLHRSVLRLAQRAQQGSDEWLPPRESFIQNSRVNVNSLAAWLHTELSADSRVRSVRSNGGGGRRRSNARGRRDLPITRMGAAVGLAADLETLAGHDKCEHAVFVFLAEPVPGAYDVHTQRIEANGTGGRRMVSTAYEYNQTTGRTHRASSISPFQCSVALQGLEEALTSDFGNWSWTYEDEELEKGSRFFLHGTAPIYSPDGLRAVGRVYANTNNNAFSRALAWVLDQSRTTWTDGGHFLLVDREARILAQTEFPQNTPENVSELPTDSYLLAAVEAVVAERGEMCPEVTSSMEHENRLVDVAAFLAEEWGMPPLGALRLCVIMTLPRENIYGPIDEAKHNVDVSGWVMLAVWSVVLALLFLTLVSGNQERKRLELDKLRMDLRKVDESIKEVKELNCPMALISAANFLALESLEHHEVLRDQRKLVVLDSLDGNGGILKFQEQNLIVFISHQWLGFHFPDVKGAGQLRIMQDAIRRCMRDPIGGKTVYVWVDYISIAQCHSQLQWAAVSSLPVYASVADIFIIVAPTLQHADTHRECNLETYMRRGWCRAEMLSKACAGGLKDMYVATGEQESGTLPLLQDVSAFSLNVFEGEFTVKVDQESLVKPVLGLYSLVLEDPSSEHMQQIHSHILEDKEAFFPRTYLNGKGDDVELFGPCVDLLHNALRENRPLFPPRT